MIECAGTLIGSAERVIECVGTPIESCRNQRSNARNPDRIPSESAIECRRNADRITSEYAPELSGDVNATSGACAGDTVLGRGDGRHGAGRRWPTRPHAERLGRVWPRPTRGLSASEPPPPVGSGTGGTKENAIRWATCKQR